MSRYWKNIKRIHQKQTQKGIATYGQPLEQNNTVNIVEKLTYLEEELVDALMYIEWAKEELERKNNGLQG